MSVRNLKALFRPQSVAVIGATTKPKAPGSVVMKNLLQANFAGPIIPVTAEHPSVAGVLAYPDIASMPMVPDLAVICTPASTVPGLIRALGEKGTRAACVMSSGLEMEKDSEGRSLLEAALAEAKPFGLRVLGPNSMGILVPGIGLNASIAPEDALKGKIAFVSQSGALCTAVLDWACTKGIGFSHFIHTGEGADISIGDILDYLGSDPYTRAILLYLETLRGRRNFMSAARAAARNKPILVIKAGRSTEGMAAASSHTGSLAVSDMVFDAAIRRAGMLRVQDIDELFGAVETLARSRPVKGKRLAIVTNGGGIGVIAADDLADGGGELARLPDEVVEKLSAVLPAGWSHRNPINIFSEADGERYAKVLGILLETKAVDGVLVMYAPTAMSDPEQVAEAVIKVFKEKTRANIMTCWVGSEKVANARRMLAEAAVPTFETPYAAVQGFLHLLEYKRNQEMLMEVPASAASDFIPDSGFVRDIINEVIARGDSLMTEAEAKAVLDAYGVPTIETRMARHPAEASRIAKSLNAPVALKILSPDIVHKSDVGGVVLNLETPFEVEKAANSMLARVQKTYPDARIEGFTVQKMASRKPGAQELIVGIATDPLFGPVILFGQGGVAVEVIGDRAVALPPLNLNLAADLVQRTRVASLLQEYRGRPPANLDALHSVLIQVSQLIVDFPQIKELDINPLRCDSEGVIALDAVIKVGPGTKGPHRMAIRPYPAELEEIFTMQDGSGRKTLLRPIRPEDEPNHHVLVSKMTPEDIRFRFFGLVHELPHSEMARLTQIDYDREMAFIAEYTHENGTKETLGVVRTVTDPDNEKAEFAVLVRSDLKGTGLGKRLLVKMIEYCHSRGTGVIVGQVLKDNTRMLKFVEHLGFVQTKTIDGDIVEVEYDLSKPPPTEPEPPEAQ
ncbi:bifunctional acetate--CoA ligase family protein/GNAT family N-acetyltransferase [Magnetospirillum aberrantis]|uniref:Bifunctional acetate--CoA ligase family protein/GNAT family N-acetyltransferase n=1 Tax=Magnetospirillum aberrantis SpK TaxID=908842 RepID=A0A7C9UXG5_9PROT|nr:GNAT family N-acetyltransferase [Magnetospirillum aberrantis]NFV79091.1 bifunctional acetate--CoA ligase family protein/GNAT family N-acetyltransferase [Magnetospirillum aberrantis SpK]